MGAESEGSASKVGRASLPAAFSAKRKAAGAIQAYSASRFAGKDARATLFAFRTQQRQFPRQRRQMLLLPRGFRVKQQDHEQQSGNRQIENQIGPAADA